VRWRSKTKCVVVVKGPGVFLLILREYLLVALRISYSLAIGESIAVGVVGVPERHTLHCITVICVRFYEINALILSGFFLTDHLRFGIFGCFGVT
jgi:hypothetical protein